MLYSIKHKLFPGGRGLPPSNSHRSSVASPLLVYASSLGSLLRTSLCTWLAAASMILAFEHMPAYEGSSKTPPLLLGQRQYSLRVVDTPPSYPGCLTTPLLARRPIAYPTARFAPLLHFDTGIGINPSPFLFAPDLHSSLKPRPVPSPR